MRINANVAAVNPGRNALASNDNSGKSLDRYAADLRAARSADDAASLSVSEGLRAEIRGTTQAQRAAQAGISYLQTTDGALTEVGSLLQRLRDVAAGAASGGTGTATADQTEVDALLGQIKGIGERTTFSGNKVFADYATSALSFAVGGSGGDVTTAIARDLTLDPASAAGVFSSALALDVTSPGGAGDAVAAIDTAIGDVSSVRGALGVTQARLERTVATLGVAVENLIASDSRVRDGDAAAQVLALTRAGILSQPDTAALAQAGSAPRSIVQLLQD